LHDISVLLKVTITNLNIKAKSSVSRKILYPGFVEKRIEMLQLLKNQCDSILEKRKKTIKDSIQPIKKKKLNLQERKEALITKFNIRTIFPSNEILVPIFDGRIDFTNQPAITIDEDKSPDLDDAIYLEKDDRYYYLYVHISDAHEYLKINPLIKEEAIKRSTSIYLPDHTINMLPEQLCLDLCSLNQGKIRPVYTHMFKIDRNGSVESYKCVKGTICVNRRLSYIKADEILEDGDNNKQLEYMLNHMSELAFVLKRRNELRRIDNAIQEEFNSESGVTSNHIIEEFSILPGTAVGEYFSRNRYPAFYRVHPEPVSGIMSRATYQTENIGHFGLGLNSYTHVTSPIRRICDLVMEELIDTFVINENPRDEDYNYYSELTKQLVPSINENCTKAKEYTKKYNQLLWIERMKEEHKHKKM
jgi:exoribonuclease R